MTKIVYNGCFGGFSLSEAAVFRYAEIKGVTVFPERDERWSHATYWTAPPTDPERMRADAIQDNFTQASEEDRKWSNDYCDDHQLSTRDFSRADPALVQVVEELGGVANGDFASLQIRDVPAGTKYRIDEYDGRELVMTVDDYDWETA